MKYTGCESIGQSRQSNAGGNCGQTLVDPLEIKLTLSILRAFIDRGYSYQARTNWKPKHSPEPDSYRVFCYIRKSKETLIINTKHTDTKALLLQIRMLDPSIFDHLNEYSDTIQRQILLDSTDCKHCGCSDKAYAFQYKNRAYRKCHMLCENFRLHAQTDDDVQSIMDIVQREIIFEAQK